jgi:hypothetical protein
VNEEIVEDLGQRMEQNSKKSLRMLSLQANVLRRTKNFGRHCLSIQKKKIVIRTLLSS